MLATQANHVIHDGKLARGCIVRIKSFQSNVVKGKKYVFFADSIIKKTLTNFILSTAF